jgi:hypothetical protein
MCGNPDICLHNGIVVSKQKTPMTILKTTIDSLTESEWEELVALKQAINDDPASVHYKKMERFTELMVRSLQERGG